MRIPLSGVKFLSTQPKLKHDEAAFSGKRNSAMYTNDGVAVAASAPAAAAAPVAVATEMSHLPEV